METRSGISKFLKKTDNNDFNNSELLDENFSGAVGKTKNISLAMDSYRVVNPNGANRLMKTLSPNGEYLVTQMGLPISFGTVISGYKKSMRLPDFNYYDVIEFQFKYPTKPDYFTQYLLASDVQKIGIKQSDNNPEDFSNFRLFGIGKESEAQKKRRAKLKKALEDAKKNIKQTTKDIGKNIQQTTKEITQNKNLKQSLKANFLTYNPAVAIPRSSALLAFRVNLFGVSSRLYPAFLDEEGLKKYNFDIENAKNAKVAWEKIANFWEDKIGGDRKKLKEAISGAWNKPVFKTKKAKARKESTSTFEGDYVCNDEYSNACADPYSCLAVSGYISAGVSLITGVVKTIADSKAKKNPYNAGTPEYAKFENQMSGEVPPALNQDDLNKLIVLAQGDKAKGLPLDNTGIDASDLDKDKEDENKILGMSKPVFYIGLGILVLVGGFITYKLVTKKGK